MINHCLFPICPRQNPANGLKKSAGEGLSRQQIKMSLDEKNIVLPLASRIDKSREFDSKLRVELPDVSTKPGMYRQTEVPRLEEIRLSGQPETAEVDEYFNVPGEGDKEYEDKSASDYSSPVIRTVPGISYPPIGSELRTSPLAGSGGRQSSTGPASRLLLESPGGIPVLRIVVLLFRNHLYAANLSITGFDTSTPGQTGNHRRRRKTV